MTMEIDDETLRRIELYREWKTGYDQGADDMERRNNIIIEDLVIRINQLEAQLSEFKNSDGGYIQ